MACFVYIFQCSKSWLALLLPILALFARFSSGHGSLLISITVSILLILVSTLFLFTFSKQKDNLILKEAENECPPQEKTLFNSQDKVEEDASDQKGLLMGSQDLYSESESMEQFSSEEEEEEEEEEHSSDTEWPYNMERRTLDCSDDSISDEESLIEIAIPSGQFMNLKYCKLSADFSHQESMFQKHSAVDFLAGINEMNEEDNLIEIDIYMGSIKCSSFEI